MSKNFFEDGIRFECQKCGACCDVEGGAVYLTDEEITAVSFFMGILEENFRKEYLKKDDEGHLIINDEHPSKCRFLKGNKCTIYQVRPIQCRTFPFWSTLLRDESAFQNLTCPGIGKGETVPAHIIEELFMAHRNFIAKISGLA